MIDKFLALFLTIFLSSSQTVLAHGEDRPGPNGGFIRMPGAFHQEVVQVAKDQLKIYLLDINFKNPSSKNSNVEARLNANVSANCLAKDNSFFVCKFPDGSDLSKFGQRLTIKARRDGLVGNEIMYELPLKFDTKSDRHSTH